MPTRFARRLPAKPPYAAGRHPVIHPDIFNRNERSLKCFSADHSLPAVALRHCQPAPARRHSRWLRRPRLSLRGVRHLKCCIFAPNILSLPDFHGAFKPQYLARRCLRAVAVTGSGRHRPAQTRLSWGGHLDFAIDHADTGGRHLKHGMPRALS